MTLGTATLTGLAAKANVSHAEARSTRDRRGARDDTVNTSRFALNTVGLEVD